MDKQDTKNLKKRYLIWLYKTSKEALDKIERKFTQLEIDRIILKELKKADKDKKATKFIEEFITYVQNKEKGALSLKYQNQDLHPGYYYLILKLKAIEKVITRILGNKTLKEIKALYEKEMTERILKSTGEK